MSNSEKGKEQQSENQDTKASAPAENTIAGSGCPVLVPFHERKPLKEIEQSIRRDYRKHIWHRFIEAVQDYQLVEEGDKIAVAISGGKDSLLLAKLFQELKRHRLFEFELEFITMDPGYYPTIRELHIANCEYLNIPIHLFDSHIFQVIEKIAQDYPCYMCAKMRRGALYAKAKELGCNKLALGHHFNDVIETTLMNLFYAGSFKTMLPRLKSQNFEGLELIRPMYHIHEEHIEEFTRNSGIWPLNCACMVSAKKISNKRHEIKEIIRHLKVDYFEDIDKSIFTAALNVDAEGIVGWRKGGKKYSYLDFYDETDEGEEISSED
jgi:tRNA(Ile)-lysidine synthase TilS/MesJ